MKSSIKTNASGFTLIEIIIVVIIVGILASLAVPKFAQQINNAKAGEAFNMIGAFNRSFDRCYALEEAVASCDAFETEIDMKEPQSDKFAYTIDTTSVTGAAKCAAANYDIALRAESVADATNYIYGCVNAEGDVKPIMVGYGDFANITTKVDNK